ncbi:hypothetical protein [Thalassotalea fusca]
MNLHSGLMIVSALMLGNIAPANAHEYLKSASDNITHIILGTTNEPESPLFQEAELILTEVFHDLGYTFELQSITGARSLFWANSGKIDGVAFRVANLDAQAYGNLKRVDTPIFTISQSVISRQPMVIDGWASMSEYVIAYERGTIFIEEKLDMFKDAIMVSTSSQALGMVQLERADVTILNEKTAKKLFDKNELHLSTLVINQPPITQIVLYPYINEIKHPGLADSIAEVLAARNN